jgi:hypothetical protein
VQQHRAERPPLPTERRLLLVFRSGQFWAGVCPFGFAVFLAYLGLRFLLRPELVGAGIVFGLAVIFGIIGLYCFRLAWNDSHRFTVGPPSSVTQAFDFSDDLKELFEPERHRYTMRSTQFAAAFVELNRKRIWRPDGRRALVAERKRDLLVKVFLVVAGLIFVYGILDDMGLLPFK